MTVLYLTLLIAGTTFLRIAMKAPKSSIFAIVR